MKSKILIFFLIILILPLVSAQCLDVKIARSEYFSGETFQAEITGNLSKPITQSNIHFYNNNEEYYPFFNFIQVSSNKWVVHFDVAKTYGNNTFSVSALCNEKILRQEKKEINFIIKNTYDSFYNFVMGKVDGKWNSLDVTDNSLAILALSYDQTLADDGKNSLLSKSYQDKCFPSTCNVKETSLALLALDKTNHSTEKLEKIINWLHDSENNVKIGLWDIIINSPSNQTCQMTIDSTSQQLNLIGGKTNSFTLSLPDNSEIPISLNCSVSSAKISHTLMGEINEFPMTIQNGTPSIILNNNKCWGTSYRNSCDPTSTAYAISALKSFGESLYSEINWLKQNAQTTEEKAWSYSFGDSQLSDYLLNNQAPEGYWSESSLAVSSTPSISSTVSVLRFLNNPVAKQKGEAWLFNTLQSSQDLKEILLGLQIFSYDKIEPLLSFSPGFFKVPSQSNQTITLTNKGIFPVNATISIDSISKEVFLSPMERKAVSLSIPPTSSIEFTSIDVDYSNYDLERSYSIPIIIYPKSYSQNQIENLSSGNVDTSFMTSKISFIEQSLNKTLAPSSQSQFDLTVKNSGTSSENVSITFLGLFEVIDKIVPSDFEIGPNETKKITVYFDTQRAFGEYNGIISLETQTPSNIPVYVMISSGATPSNQTDDEPTVTGGSKINMTYVGIGMIVLAIVAAAAFFYFKLRKKEKPELMIALEKLKKEQLQ